MGRWRPEPATGVVLGVVVMKGRAVPTLLALLCALLFAGCSEGSQPMKGASNGSADASARDGVISSIQRDVEAIEGVTWAKVTYADNAAVDHGATVGFEVDSAERLAPAAQAIAGLVWRSSLTELRSMAVWGSVGGQDPRVNDFYRLSDTETIRRLTEQFGPRPFN